VDVIIQEKITVTYII